MTIDTKFDVGQAVYGIFMVKHLQEQTIKRVFVEADQRGTRISYETSVNDNAREEELHATPEEAVAAQIARFNGHIDKLNTQLLSI